MGYNFHTFVLEQIRIIEFPLLDHYHTLNCFTVVTSVTCGRGIQEAIFTTSNARGKALKGLKGMME